MRNTSFLSFLLPGLFEPVLSTHIDSSSSPPPNLNVTALTYQTNTTDNTSISILQCWTLASPFVVPTIGSGPLGAAVTSLGGVMGNMSFIVQAPGSVGGYKNAPAPQWSILLSGIIHITLPSSPHEAYITGGRYGLIYADDVNTTGHNTDFPSGDETVLLGIPTGDGKQPGHTVLHEGACGLGDLVGW